MPEKTMKSNKRIILLRSFSILCAVAVVLSCIVLPTFAADYFNYREFEVEVVVDGPNDLVTCIIPSELATVGIRNSAWHTIAEGKGSVTYDFVAGETYNAYLWPMPKILSLKNIPAGATFQFAFNIDSGNLSAAPRIETKYDYYVGDTSVSLHGGPSFVEPAYGLYFIDGIIDPPSEDVDGMGCSLWLHDIKPYESGPITITSLNFKMQFSISSYYRLLEISGNSDALLDEVNRQLREQGMTMDDILKQQEQTNDKLDQLPGQIGDEMQGIIDSEKQEAESSGNDFVDQILGELPDPSTDVLAALKSLTDATAYTGTDAVLPIPAIVLPGIDGLFPETVIWEGTEFDFGEYLGFIPSSLLTLVQALFTIAIVLFCVYELKGIISYCLTLRESKGG